MQACWSQKAAQMLLRVLAGLQEPLSLVMTYEKTRTQLNFQIPEEFCKTAGSNTKPKHVFTYKRNTFDLEGLTVDLEAHYPIFTESLFTHTHTVQRVQKCKKIPP